MTELMARGGRFTGDVGNDGDNVDDGENDNGDAEDKAFDEDKGNRCVRLADQLRLTAESLAAFLSSVDRFLTTPSSSYPPCSLMLISDSVTHYRGISAKAPGGWGFIFC